MIQLRALVHLGNKVACKNPQTSLVLKILRNRFQRLVSFFVTKNEKNTQNVNIILVSFPRLKYLKKREKWLQCMEVRNGGTCGPWSIQSRSAYQSRKNSFVYIYALVDQGTHEWNLKKKKKTLVNVALTQIQIFLPTSGLREIWIRNNWFGSG